MHKYAIEDIATALANARKGKGLTQKELGEAVGWPQSHVSKFEKGDNDIRLSGLIEFARALDLEVMLVPKKSVPAVQSVVRQTQGLPDDRTASALRTIEALSDRVSRSDTVSALDNLKLAPDEIARVLIDLRPFRFPAVAAERLQRLSSSLNRAFDTITGGFPRTPALMDSAARTILDSTRGLRDLRNALAHPQGLSPTSPTVRPAYSLEDDDHG
jgi:transcriptional regulator with XRE-family HTH domain